MDRSSNNTTDETPLPTVNGFSTKKRKNESDDCSSSSKRAKAEDVPESLSNLVMLPDDVLLIILSYLEHYSLLQLKATCTLFARLCQDYTLWRNVDFGENLVTSAELELLASNVNTETKSIRIVGKNDNPESQEDLLTLEWFDEISNKCPSLEKLALPNHLIDCKSITIIDFPSSLTHLDLSNTFLRQLPEERSYFKEISVVIPNLKVLILSNCLWFEPHSLMAISKCRNLEELRLNDCAQVKHCLAYCGLSTRGGFQNLKTLDLRRCSISNSELMCFSSVPTLKNLYLESSEQATVCVDTGCIDPALIVMCAHPWQNVLQQRVQIEKLAVRHYRLLNDETLLKLASDAQTLKYLDVTGSFSYGAVATFRKMRPQIKLVTSEEVSY